MKQILDFGKMPLANGFLDKDQFEQEKFYDLQLGFCPDCNMVQLINPLAPELLFNNSYPFLTSSSKGMELHFKGLVESALGNINTTKPRVIEIGSNDGSLLKMAQAQGAKVLGIEPSANIGMMAQRSGIRTLLTAFDSVVAEMLSQTHESADIIIATNTLCHVHDLADILTGIKKILNPDGIFVFEDPYLPDILRLVAYDQIYDEHKWYFSVTSMENILQRYGLRLVAVESRQVHGGSMRYWVQHASKDQWNDSVSIAIGQEKFITMERLLEFKYDVGAEIWVTKTSITNALKEGLRIAGYGATSKSTIILNLLELNDFHIQYITDTTIQKQGKFSPGSHIPIVAPSILQKDDIDAIMIFAWNHWEEIVENDLIFAREEVAIMVHSRKIAERMLL